MKSTGMNSECHDEPSDNNEEHYIESNGKTIGHMIVLDWYKYREHN